MARQRGANHRRDDEHGRDRGRDRFRAGTLRNGKPIHEPENRRRETADNTCSNHVFRNQTPACVSRTKLNKIED